MILDAQMTMSYIALIGSLIPVLGAIIASYITLSSRMTRIETKMIDNEKNSDRVEAESSAHYTRMVSKIDSLQLGITNVEKAIIETSLKRQAEFAQVAKMLEAVIKNMEAQETRITNLESLNQRLYEIPVKVPRTVRRKNNQD